MICWVRRGQHESFPYHHRQGLVGKALGLPAHPRLLGDCRIAILMAVREKLPPIVTGYRLTTSVERQRCSGRRHLLRSMFLRGCAQRAFLDPHRQFARRCLPVNSGFAAAAVPAQIPGAHVSSPPILSHSQSGVSQAPLPVFPGGGSPGDVHEGATTAPGTARAPTIGTCHGRQRWRRLVAISAAAWTCTPTSRERERRTAPPRSTEFASDVV